jgi:hypothetical protein
VRIVKIIFPTERGIHAASNVSIHKPLKGLDVFRLPISKWRKYRAPMELSMDINPDGKDFYLFGIIPSIVF